jgi:hypothetical protein
MTGEWQSERSIPFSVSRSVLGYNRTDPSACAHVLDLLSGVEVAGLQLAEVVGTWCDIHVEVAHARRFWPEPSRGSNRQVRRLQSPNRNPSASVLPQLGGAISFLVLSPQRRLSTRQHKNQSSAGGFTSIRTICPVPGVETAPKFDT